MILKKSKHILSLAISRNEMNEKADFEIILKRWEHVAYATVRTITMIIISMIINQNFTNT